MKTYYQVRLGEIPAAASVSSIFTFAVLNCDYEHGAIVRLTEGLLSISSQACGDDSWG